MKFKDLKSKSVDELEKIKQDVAKEIIKEKALIKIGTQPKNPGKFKESKKTIARINRLLADAKKK